MNMKVLVLFTFSAYGVEIHTCEKATPAVRVY